MQVVVRILAGFGGQDQRFRVQAFGAWGLGFRVYSSMCISSLATCRAFAASSSHAQPLPDLPTQHVKMIQKDFNIHLGSLDL